MTNIHRDFYPTGELWREIMLIDNKIHGSSKEWYPNGQIKGEANYVDNKPHGSYKSWHSNGILAIETAFVDGKMHGSYKQWWENGQLSCEASHVYDKLHGSYKQWDINNDLIIDTVYSHDRRLTPEELTALQTLIKFRSKVKAIASCFNTTPRGFSRLLSVIKTREFNEWWYHPDGVGGKRHKQIMNKWFNEKFKPDEN